MAEGQPHLSIQMSDLNTNDTPSRKQSSANLAVRGGSILTFHNISYHVKMKTGFLCCQKPADKEVLRDVKYVFKYLFRACLCCFSVWTVESTGVTEPLSTIYRIWSRLEKMHACMVALCLLSTVLKLPSGPQSLNFYNSTSLYNRELTLLAPGRDCLLWLLIGMGAHKPAVVVLHYLASLPLCCGV